MLTDHASEVRELCLRYGVTRLEAFGSSVTGAFTDSSDLDFLVEFDDADTGSLFDRYFDLRDALIALFGREVDLVEIRAIRNPRFLDVIASSRRVIYAG